MRILNIHQRNIAQPKERVARLIDTLSATEDQVWPHENWPRMKLDHGLEVGSKGGHGPIRYLVREYKAGEFIQFEFTYPKGFHGYHQLELIALDTESTKVKHTIEMQTSGKDTLLWLLAVRWLHDALIEDAFDKLENRLDSKNRRSPWSFWVKFCRVILKPKRK